MKAQAKTIVLNGEVKSSFVKHNKAAKPKATEAGKQVKAKAVLATAAIVGVAGTISGNISGFFKGLVS